jgi:hypothetical protein
VKRSPELFRILNEHLEKENGLIMKILQSWLAKAKEFIIGSKLGIALAGGIVNLTIQSRDDGKAIKKSIRVIKIGNRLQTLSERGKDWWKHIKNGAPVDLVINGQRTTGWAEVIEDPELVHHHWETMHQRLGQKINNVIHSETPQSGDFGIDSSALSGYVLISIQLT